MHVCNLFKRKPEKLNKNESILNNSGGLTILVTIAYINIVTIAWVTGSYDPQPSLYSGGYDPKTVTI